LHVAHGSDWQLLTSWLPARHSIVPGWKAAAIRQSGSMPPWRRVGVCHMAQRTSVTHRGQQSATHVNPRQAMAVPLACVCDLPMWRCGLCYGAHQQASLHHALQVFMVYSFVQGVAAMQAGASVIQPNVGRVRDWYNRHPGRRYAAYASSTAMSPS
jgi:hypothetical protein